MAVVVESVATGQSPITKPTGLAEGDVMVALVGSGAASTPATPSGWTSIGAEQYLYGFGAFTKVAEASDVAASNFTFQDAASNHLYGALYRLTSAASNAVTAFSYSPITDNNGDATIAVNPNITPTVASYLCISAFKVYKSGVTGANSAYTMTGSPTFTERYDAAISANVTFSIADAVVNSATAITNIQCTTSIANDDARVYPVVIYEPLNDAAAVASLLTATINIYPTIPQRINATSTIYTPTASLVTPTWSNTSKNNATNVLNTDKS